MGLTQLQAHHTASPPRTQLQPGRCPHPCSTAARRPPAGHGERLREGARCWKPELRGRALPSEGWLLLPSPEGPKDTEEGRVARPQPHRPLR